MKKLCFLLVLFSLNVALASASCTGSSPNWTATPDQSSVQTCINNASSGDTVNVAAGSATWGLNGVSLNKNLTLSGAGTGVTVITETGHPTFSVIKQSSGVIRIQNITFTSATGAGTLPHPLTLSGGWPSNGAIVFQNVEFITNDDTSIDNFLAGGVVFSHVNWHSAHWGDFFMTIKDDSHGSSWTMADSFGTHDSTGLMNHYIEDSTFNGGANGVFDCDDNCRIVIRHNSFIESGGFNSHGNDSSPYGMREFEIYANSFTFPDKSCANGQTSLSNINDYIWIRGASGVIYNNSFDHLSSVCWGTKAEIKLANRGAEDDRPQGACSSTHYPTPHQLGQNHNGSADFTDPIAFWGNTGATISVSAGWAWNNPCGFDWNTFFQWGRDGVNSSLSLPISLSNSGGNVTGIGGSSKPGYSAYTYPHPLAGTSSSNAPAAPSNLAATVQ